MFKKTLTLIIAATALFSFNANANDMTNAEICQKSCQSQCPSMVFLIKLLGAKTAPYLQELNTCVSTCQANCK